MDKENIFLGALIIIVGFLSYLIIRPEISYILAAIILSFVSYPIYKVIRKVLRNHTISAILVILLMFVIVIAPSFYAGKVLFVQTSNVISKIGSINMDKLDTSQLEQSIEKFTGHSIDLKQKIREGVYQVSAYLARGLIGFAGKMATFAIGIFIMLFTMFYLYYDGEAIVDWLKKIIPIKKEYKEYLIDEMAKVTKAILVGVILTAIIQGLIAALGFYLFGFSNALFWGLLSAILYILPIVGPFLIFVPMGIYGIVTGNLFSGIGILLYGFVILNNTDNLIRPKLVHMQTNIHPVVILLGIFGGLYMFGFIGIFIGPLILALFLALLKIYSNEDVIYEHIRKKEEKLRKKRRKHLNKTEVPKIS